MFNPPYKLYTILYAQRTSCILNKHKETTLFEINVLSLFIDRIVILKKNSNPQNATLCPIEVFVSSHPRAMLQPPRPLAPAANHGEARRDGARWSAAAIKSPIISTEGLRGLRVLWTGA